MSTLSERILQAPAGEFVDRAVDHAYVHDGTGVLTLEAWRQIADCVASPPHLYVMFDHIAPANNSVTANLQHELREFAREKGFHFSDVGCGISHQLMAEGEVLPGEIVVGADSHTCTVGAFGAFATGVGATDMAAIWASGCTWFRVPETIALSLEGRLQAPAAAKDLALTYVGKLGMDGASYRALEFIGDGISSLEMDDRLTLCNLAVETGAKAGLCYADHTTRRYLAAWGKEIAVQGAEDCAYEREICIDLTDVVPMVACPPRVDAVKPVTEMEGVSLDQVFVGTCTNGRYSDLAVLARGIRGKKVAVRTIVAPASHAVLKEAVRTGVLNDLVSAGCTILPPGCGPCLGAHMGVLGEEEVCLSTANRNFKNRMGVGGEIYLSSVATAAASALKGVISGPEDLYED
jgi:methanogen homoaconitase large subunit